MKITLTRGDETLAMQTVENGTYIEPKEGKHVCQACKAPLRAVGSEAHRSEDDRGYEAQGYCRDCGKGLGRIRVETGTLFGVSEDERVLGGPWKVY